MAKKDGAVVPMTLEDWLNTRASWLRMAADGVIKNRRMPTEDELEALTTTVCLKQPRFWMHRILRWLRALFSEPLALVRCGSIP